MPGPKNNRKINSLVRAAHQLTLVGIATKTKQNQTTKKSTTSLINLDTKTASKALAKRLEHILPDLIHYN